MFVQELHDFDFRVGHDARLARVNVQLEQSAHTIGSIFTDRYVEHSLAVVVDRVLIDAVRCTQHLARACAVKTRWCVMQRRSTFFFVWKTRFRCWNYKHFPQKKHSSKNWPVADSLVPSRAPSNQCQQRIGAPVGSCSMYWFLTYKTTQREIEANW